MYKPTKAENKVMTVLEQNCRLPASQIAKKTRLSTEGVIKIINRLKDRNIILKFNTKINYSRMGYKLFPVHIKLNNRNKQVIKQIKDIIKKHPSCAWHTFCEGEYDLLLSFRIGDRKEKQDMETMLLELAEYTLEKDLFSVLKAFSVGKSFTETRKTYKNIPILDYRLEQANLTEKDLKLINTIKSNARKTILDIAKETKTTARVAASRIKRLQRENIITGFKTRLNMAKLGYQPCNAMIILGKCTTKEYNNFVTYCQYTRGIHYFLRQMGKYDIELTFNARNTTDFYNQIDTIRSKFPFIKKISTLILKDE